jgi:superfamily I DNA/RNA helicase
MNTEQRAAVDAHGEVFVSAGAGTGKTTVLVERFVRAVCDEGLDVESVLVITYTRKAAGELRARIRAALQRRGRPELARRLDGAWISTIHGFCGRTRSRSASTRASASSTRSTGRCCGASRSSSHSQRSVRRAIPSGSGCSRPTVRPVCAAC